MWRADALGEPGDVGEFDPLRLMRYALVVEHNPAGVIRPSPLGVECLKHFTHLVFHTLGDHAWYLVAFPGMS